MTFNSLDDLVRYFDIDADALKAKLATAGFDYMEAQKAVFDNRAASPNKKRKHRLPFFLSKAALRLRYRHPDNCSNQSRTNKLHVERPHLPKQALLNVFKPFTHFLQFLMKVSTPSHHTKQNNSAAIGWDILCLQTVATRPNRSPKLNTITALNAAITLPSNQLAVDRDVPTRSFINATGHSNMEIDDVSAAMVIKTKNTKAMKVPATPRPSNNVGSTSNTSVGRTQQFHHVGRRFRRLVPWRRTLQA